ncbi:Uncharacterized protein FWK35_00039259, partial [Aphis craccivora]
MNNRSVSERTQRRRVREELDTYNFISINDSDESTNEMPVVDNDNCSDLSIHQEVTPLLNTSIYHTEDNNLELEYHDFDYFEDHNYIIDNVQLHNESDSTSTNNVSDHFMANYSIDSEIAQWALLHKIPHTAVNNLLLILRKHKCFFHLPKDARTLLHTKPVQMQTIRDVHPGKYHHFGLEIGMLRHLSHENTVQNEIKVVIGIDGLPIAKSNSNQFYPILAYMRPTSNIVFPVGLYFGIEKPSDSNVFLKDYINEAKHLVSHGILVENKLFKVKIDVFCCDSPAKAFILRIKSHNGFFSCSRCEIEGVYKSNRVFFPYSEPNRQPNKRTHTGYLARSQNRHHQASITNSCITEIPGLDIV